MPQTPVYGLPIEAPGDLPGHTLDGGPVGDQPILAEAVEAEASRVANDIAGLAEDIEEAAVGWTPIGAGEQSNVSAFVIDVTAGGKYPPGTFSLMRLYLRGEMDGDAQWVSLNINNSLTEDSHRTSWLRYNAQGSLEASGHEDRVTWRIAYWSGTLIANVAQVTLYATNTPSYVSYEATGTYIATGGSASNRSVTWGRLNENRLVTSLRVGRIGTADIATCRWWLEGWRN